MSDGPATRRRWLAGVAAAAGATATGAAAATAAAPLTRRIPSTGEVVPVIGLGSWITFNVGNDTAARATCVEVVRAFFVYGGRMIDSSPMYGSSQPTIGHALARLGIRRRCSRPRRCGSANAARGDAQMAASAAHWGVPRFDLMQVHNLLNWKDHLQTLRDWQDKGRFRYIGVTTSHGRKHDEVDRILRREPIDLLQITLNLADRSAEPLLQLAAERGVAVIINRPFDGGLLFNHVGPRPLPAIARDIGCANWAQVFLKWILAHPAVTCAIPATTNPAHMDENMGALRGPLPDAAQRRAWPRRRCDRLGDDRRRPAGG